MNWVGVKDCTVIRKELFSAHKCLDDYSCLTGDRKCLCKVKTLVGSKILFVEKPPLDACGYKISFGLSTICNCPVRKKIYTLHGV